jgi:hypothetical protein
MVAGLSDKNVVKEWYAHIQDKQSDGDEQDSSGY